DAEVYRRQFAEWRSKIAALNKSVYDTLEAWGPDPPGLRPGDVDMVELGGGVKLKMVYIAPGRFEMGSNNGDNDEQAVHTVRISEPYGLGKYEVTQREYQQVMGENPSRFKGTRRPVEMVSWKKAVEFCRKLTEQDHRTGRLPAEYEYTLPSEAQWEYAARGGEKSKGYVYAGSDSIGEIAWYDGNSGNTTHEVGGLKANELGLYDMSGNVWEWCMDKWHDSYNGAPEDGSVWMSGNSSFRVSRGGGWGNSARLCRSAIRDCDALSRTRSYLGFRVALVRK
ncbi:MAG: formylglycine-generating enzyme family protein, partial [Spartobacteria bacterium]|nr:formylglycine-generating enzyme family protein [Spartobacteria bacterium]